MKIASKRSLIRLGAALLVLGGVWMFMIGMPGKSHRGPLPPLTERQRELAGALERHVRVLADDIGNRNVFSPDALQAAADYVAAQLAAAGYAVATQAFAAAGVPCRNLIAERPGGARAREIVLVGAHYDSAELCPAANDNGTGVAALLELARRFASASPARTLRFVAFANEEPPFFETDRMGSAVYARACRAAREDVAAMISLETLGYYSDAPGSQRYPPPFSLVYPDTGNFIAFIGTLGARGLVRRAVGSFRRHAAFPSEGAAIPYWVPGAMWSDHGPFQAEGYPALMVTDTAPYRYPHYHQPGDTPDKVDFARLARVTDGLEGVIRDLAAAP